MGQRLRPQTNAVATSRRRPLIGVLCCNRVVNGRRAQVVASRFLQPLSAIADAAVLLVPALPNAMDEVRFAGVLDGLLLTGSCSNLSAARYGQARDDACEDVDRDEVALSLAAAMIEAGRPVFGICRGLQELNVLFGGSLTGDVGFAGHHCGRGDDEVEALFAHHHAVEVIAGGVLAANMGAGQHRVNSAHNQGIDRLGGGLTVEARASDGLIEAISAQPAGGPVVGVQWHPEWDADENPDSRSFFEVLGEAARGEHDRSARRYS